MNTSTAVFANAFTSDEISKLIEHFDTAPITISEPTGNINKNLDYHLTNSVSNRIIYPKIQATIGDHKFASGAYKECCLPYGLHYDNAQMHNANHPVVDRSVDKNRAILIPLVEGPEFSTITFKVFTDKIVERNALVPDKYLGQPNGLDPEYFSHIPDQARAQCARLPVDTVYQWKVGDMLMWDRNQLHCSANFLRFDRNVVKKFIVIFVA